LRLFVEPAKLGPGPVKPTLCSSGRIDVDIFLSSYSDSGDACDNDRGRPDGDRIGGSIRVFLVSRVRIDFGGSAAPTLLHHMSKFMSQ
jgi:hypothetical protein